METQFERLGLVAERVGAVSTDELTRAQLAEFCSPARGEWRTPSELACALSHLKVLEQIEGGSAAHALVLEDDAVLSQTLSRFLAEYSAQEDILRIETALHPVRSGPIERRVGDIGIAKYFGGVAGAAGYIISQAAAATVIAGHWLPRLPADLVLCNSYQVASMGLTVRHTDPGMCVQSYLYGDNTLGSDLTDRNGRAVVEGPFWRDRIPYLVTEGIKRDVFVGVANTWHQYFGGARKRLIPFKAD